MSRARAVGLGFLLTVPLLAGCLQGGPDREGPGDGTGADDGQWVDGFLLVERTFGPTGRLTAHAASGALATVTLSEAATVEVPANVYRFHEGRFLAAERFSATPNEPIALLVPPGMTRLTLRVDGIEVVVPTPRSEEAGFFQARNIIQWFKVLRDEYPNRCNGCTNYVRSQDYFAGLFRDFGAAQVEVDPYGTNPIHAEFANVVAYKYPKTDLSRPFWLGVGGHYDVVGSTREGAFDNTAGTLATLELARALANVTTSHNIVYGLWGGEEAGLQGSAFFTRTNPNIAAQMRFYVNLDVSAFSWPAPKPLALDDSEPDCSAPLPRTASSVVFCPDPVILSAGPDGPVADRLLDWGRLIQRDIAVDWPDAYFLYEPVADGQLGGYARVNAQSDHTSFIAAGVPSYFLFNGNALRNPIGIHNQRDTIANWTQYMVHGFPMDFEVELTPEEVLEAEELMARSFETYLWLTFYLFLRQDLGLHGSAAVV